MGRLTSTTDPHGSSTAYKYDNRNRLNNVRYSNGDTLDVNYDGVGNIINLTYPGIAAITSIASIGAAQSNGIASDDCNSAREIKYTFSRDEKGHLLSDANKTIDLKWDRQWLSLDRSVENRITNSNGLEIKYDAGGRITSITYPGNKIVTYEYENNRLIFVTDWTGGETSFSYDKGRLRILIKANNSVTFYQHYDSKHPLFEDIVDGLSDVTIEEASRVITLTERAADAGAARIGASTMAYNKANKIIYEKSTGLMDGSATDLGFKFRGFPDVNDEREKLDILNYDKTNRLVGIGITGVEDLISYDSRGRVNQGRLSNDKRRKYCWDKASRLIEYFTINETTSNVEKQVSLSYDAFNRVIRRNETYSGGKLVENFTWNYALGVPRVSITADIDSGKTWYHIYTPKGDLLHSIREGDNAKYFYHFDLLGNTAFLSNEDGKIVERYGYSVYGKYGYEYEPRLEKIDYINRFTYKGMFGWMNEDPQELSHPGTGSQKASSLGVNFRPLYLTGQNYYDSFLYGNLKPSVINFIDAYQFNPYQMGRGSPSGWVRLGGLVRGVFGALESIIGVAGAIVDPEPFTKVGFAALAAHGVDDAYTGWNTFTTGRFQVSGTERVVAAGWEAAGASPEVAAGAGAGFDFGFSLASGIAGPKALARSFRARALLQSGELSGASRSLNILSNSSSGSLATIAGMDATVVESALALAVKTGDEIIFRGKTVWLLHNKSRGIITVVAHANSAELAGLRAPAFATGLRQALMARGITGVRGVHLTSCRSGCGLFGDFLATQLRVPVRASLGKTFLLIERRVGVHQVLINGKWTDEAGGFVTKWPIIR